MPHIQLDEGVPGIVSLFQYNPATARPISELAEELLRGESTLSVGERETVAAFVSRLNDCEYCDRCHSWTAALTPGADWDTVEAVKQDFEQAPIGEKLRALLRIAAKVQVSGKEVRTEDIEAAKAHGATDQEIHDVVLIAAMFCMVNRYVDGLAAWTPEDDALYEQSAHRLRTRGYIRPSWEKDSQAQ